MFGFFKGKKELTLPLFVNGYFLELLVKIIDSEFELLKKDIRDYSSIEMTDNELLFEFYLMLVYLSGRSLSLIKGFDSRSLDFIMIMDKIFQEKFGKIRLNNRWLDQERGEALSDMFNYYKNKSDAYKELEIQYHNNQIDKTIFNKGVCQIFFSLESESIDDKLVEIMGELHKGSFMYIYKKLSVFAKEYQLVD